MRDKINAIITEMQLKVDELWERSIELSSKERHTAAFALEDQAELLEHFIEKLEVANNG